MIAPVTSGHPVYGPLVNIFPVVHADGKQLLACGIGRVNLRLQPLFKHTCEPKILKNHLDTAYSLTEQEILRGDGDCQIFDAPTMALLRLKGSLANIISSAVGQSHLQPVQGQCYTSFMLTANGQCDTLFLARALLHDLDSGSVVLDAFVIPLRDTLPKDLQKLHQGLLTRSQT